MTSPGQVDQPDYFVIGSGYMTTGQGTPPTTNGQVPEPGTIVLLTTGLGAVVLAARKRAARS